MRYGCVIDIDVNTSFSQGLTPEFQSINQSINQLYLNTVNGSAIWFSDMPCDNYKL